jgi:hypothetical protein
MATTVVYGKLGANIFGGETAGESVAIDFLSDTIKYSLHTSTYAPNQDTNEFFDVATNELATANGYTAGGVTAASKTSVYTAGTNTTAHDSADAAWTASGGSIGPFRYMVVRKDTGVASTSPLICYVDFGSDQTITNGNIGTVVFDATDGVFKVVAT